MIGMELFISALVAGVSGMLLYILNSINSAVKQNSQHLYDMREVLSGKIGEVHDRVGLVERHLGEINSGLKATQVELNAHIRTDEHFHAEISRRVDRIESGK